ncbi:hypothetical protein TRIUR3_05048 [Triticum urartu]|uniref:Uncharacterized protein n=1 Tax=Triticum urartu TaxID=4572 RepID=M8AVB2_TRIUA|nr:hypothetical protein TRIUR3_05048 [Triticum urartu]
MVARATATMGQLRCGAWSGGCDRGAVSEQPAEVDSVLRRLQDRRKRRSCNHATESENLCIQFVQVLALLHLWFIKRKVMWLQSL